MLFEKLFSVGGGFPNSHLLVWPIFQGLRKADPEFFIMSEHVGIQCLATVNWVTGITTDSCSDSLCDLTNQQPTLHACQLLSELSSSEVLLNENNKKVFSVSVWPPGLVRVGCYSPCRYSCIYPTSSPSSATSPLSRSPAASAVRETEAGEHIHSWLPFLLLDIVWQQCDR